ncbi:MAG: hypothetical protein Q8M31_00185 [Beijerinckiaceae bacterium]|nr:hypothetical protein [Beijerinckiaceae bacterium]
MVGDETIDCNLKIDTAAAFAPLSAAPCYFDEEAFDSFDPACRYRFEVVVWRGCRGSRAVTFGLLVGCVIIEGAFFIAQQTIRKRSCHRQTAVLLRVNIPIPLCSRVERNNEAVNIPYRKNVTRKAPDRSGCAAPHNDP